MQIRHACSTGRWPPSKHPEREVRTQCGEVIHQAPGMRNTQFEHELNTCKRTTEI